MKGVGWIVVLLALLGVTYLITQDLSSLTGHREGKVVIEPLRQTKEAADLANRTQKVLKDQLEGIER